MDGIVWEGLGGLSHGSFLRANDSINSSKPPGTYLPETPPETMSEMTSKILKGEAFCYSPNLTWFLMAVGMWCVFPYDLKEEESEVSGFASESTSSTMSTIFCHRLAINHCLAMGYIGFWHWALYVKGLCHRPYVPNRTYGYPKVLHNVFYTVLGIFQWTLVEVAFVHLYKSGKLPYVDATYDPTTLLHTTLLSVIIPPYRDVHFYFAHRLIHLRPMYKYVHSLHHRNTDTEPFSGLAMHPVEHMYYFTCYAPLLVLPSLLGVAVSPFLVFWMGVHLVISPAASHSGYEDHFSADLGHYLHHRYTECNYSGGINFDAYFGTHRATLTESKAKSKPSDPKSSLGLPEHPDYEVGICALVLGALWAHRRGAPPSWVALGVSVGPVAWAVVLALQNTPSFISRKKACLAPFDKDSVASLGLHLGLGVLLGVLPAAHLLVLVLQDK